MIITGKILTFAPTIPMGMKTITLRYDPDSEFAAALDELIRNSNGVSVVEEKKTKKKLTRLEKAIQEEKEGKVTTYESVDDFFEKMGIACSK